MVASRSRWVAAREPAAEGVSAGFSHETHGLAAAAELLQENDECNPPARASSVIDTALYDTQIPLSGLLPSRPARGMPLSFTTGPHACLGHFRQDDATVLNLQKTYSTLTEATGRVGDPFMFGIVS